MSKRAEQRALEAYPTQDMYSSYIDGSNRLKREVFIKGYEQAWKDIKEWIEEQVTILDKQTLLHPDDDVFWGQRNAYKQMKDKLNSLCATLKTR